MAKRWLGYFGAKLAEMADGEKRLSYFGAKMADCERRLGYFGA